MRCNCGMPRSARLGIQTLPSANSTLLTNPVMALGDPRECGYSLMALLAATVVGEDHRKSAKDLLDHINGGARRLLLDFSKLQYISSAGLRIVLLAAKRIKSRGGRMALCSLNRQIHEVFEISGFSSILDILPSYDDAVARLSAP